MFAKYVNMADVISDMHKSAAGPEAEELVELIELLFFAYRDFVGDPDRILAAYGFGRAHHRVLHFVNRQPGLMIAELLDILGITKQSLNRVLKELLDTGKLGKLQFVQASHQQDMDGWPNYWPGLPPMWYATHCVGPMLALTDAKAEYVSCFGSGTIRRELIKHYGSPFAVETAHIKFQNSDVAARIMAERMRPLLGQPVVIENVGGAGGSIAVGRVARAAPDGYTIDIGQWDTHVGSIIYNLNYDLQKDFEPVGLISVNPQLLIGRKDLPANRLNELVAWMKANPGAAKFVDQNAAARISGLLLQQLTGTQVTFIPYRGAGPAMTDLISQQVDLLVVQGAVALPQVRAGTVKAIANLSPQRSASMPDIPTSDETGVPGLYMSGWFGFFAPKGTPKDVIAKLNDAMSQVLADPTTKAKFSELGLDVASPQQQTPEGLAAFHKAEIEKWWPIIKAANIKGD